MLKITISASLLKTVSTAISALATEAAIQEKEHPFLIQKEKDSVEFEAKMFDKTVQDVIKNRAERAAKYPSKSIFDKLPLISNIKAYSDKIFTVSSTKEEVTVQINEEFITGAIEIGAKLTVKAVQPALDLASVFYSYVKEVEAFKVKWQEKEEHQQEQIASIEIPVDKVPSDILNSTEWSSKLDDHPSTSKPFFTDKEKEKYETVEDLRWTRGVESFRLSPQSTVSMLKDTNKTVVELAEYYNIPSSLVRTIYAHYKVELSPKQLGVEEVQSSTETSLTTEETIQKAFEDAALESKE